MTNVLEDRGSLESALDSLGEGFQVVSNDWRYLYVNKAAAAHGRKTREELLGRTMMECFAGIEHTQMFETLRTCMNERQSMALENEFEYPDGGRGWFDLRVQPFAQGIAVLSIDITARKQLEATLRHSQKMEALGRLAGGVAHDFNNMLTVVASYASFLKEAIPQNNSLRNDLDEILAAVDRSAKLSNKLLTFGKGQPTAPRAVQLNDLVTGIHDMLMRVLGETIQIRLDLAAHLKPAYLDVKSFEQVIVDLALNASEAMPEGGVITLTTRVSDPQDLPTDTSEKSALGEHVCLSIADTGHGMTEEVLHHVFEPFFTTKGENVGAGLGLASAYGVVRQIDGHVKIDTSRGQGTTVSLHLPVASPDLLTNVKAPPLSGTGSGSILLVEDDPQIRNVVARILQRAGYAVVVASNATEAEQTAKLRDTQFDLLLTDIVMPGGSGVQLSEKMRALNPGMAILFMSGYSKDALKSRNDIALGLAPVLQKPFSPEDLLSAVMNRLGRQLRV